MYYQTRFSFASADLRDPVVLDCVSVHLDPDAGDRVPVAAVAGGDVGIGAGAGGDAAVQLGARRKADVRRERRKNLSVQARYMPFDGTEPKGQSPEQRCRRAASSSSVCRNATPSKRDIVAGIYANFSANAHLRKAATNIWQERVSCCSVHPSD